MPGVKARVREKDSKLVVTYEDGLAEVQGKEGEKAKELREKFYILREHAMHPTSRKVVVKQLAQFFSVEGCRSYLAAEGIDPDKDVQWNIEAPKVAPSQ